MAVMAKRGPKGPLSDEHKAALARGRQEGRVVREYLEALRATKSGPGRKRTADTVTRRLAAVEEELRNADPVQELKLVQERFDLQDELEAFAAQVDIGALEQSFVEVAKGYSDRTGVSYAAWRAVGVEAAVLKAAGISRAQ
ncbi:MAG: hypothetical protein RJA49_401 [Actinomycetota bacterium]